MGKRIITVTGPVAPEDLGCCHSHEHLWIDDGPSAKCDPNLRIDDYALTLQELHAFRAAGGGAVVDAQPVGCGRDPQMLLSLSRDSEVHIIASTGFHMRRFYPEDSHIFALTAAQAQKLFEHELNVGMYLGPDEAYDRHTTAIRAGIIKCALDIPERFPLYHALFEGAVAAARSTGAPLLLHSEKGADLPAFLTYIQALGLPLEQLIVCHLDRTHSDPDLHVQVGRTGAYLEYDTIARYKYHDDRTEYSILNHVARAGLQDKILIGQDSTRARMVSYGGQPGLDFILRRFRTAPLAAECGLTASDFHAFLVENPARAFCPRATD